MRNFEIIGGSDSEKIDRVKKLITLHDCWQRQYHDAIYKAMSENKGKEIADYPQEDLMKIVLSGIKYINLVREIRRENERVGIDYRQSLEESQATFNLIDAIFTIMGYIKLKNLVITFPVTKDFDGDKWGCKDYFYTMDVLSEMDWDKPIGRDKMSDLLWDYQNNDLRSAYVEYMCVTSALYRAQTGKGIAEQWVEDVGLPTYDVDEDSGFIMDNQTGKVSKLEKSSHIQIVK